ncbi:unnamed protein product [Lecanosticta acicola]|uniref:Unnamed protein product n=1 Tax=Lecanosticta acicola TaxID=111012 RepID=A0AAI8Z5G5_9PEZI|nr:unnamed protein product [Lecanosticta acicola]
MDSPKSPPGSVRRHARNISHPAPTRATKGLLEEATDDPLAESSPADSTSSPSQITQSVQSPESQRSTPPIPEPALLPQPLRQTANLQFLKDPGIYHELFVQDVPKAFLESEHQPPANASLPDLLQGGHFRRAAEKALRDLYASPSDAAEHILQLLYTRLACLILISRPDMAAQEAIPLIDLLARNPPGAQDIVPLIPWELRLLLVRLQSIGAADGGRRGIMSLYALAGEVRSNLRRAQDAGDGTSIAMWSAHLQDLGMRVCDALVEMGELETAARHLDTLVDVDADEVTYRKALLRLRVGDFTGAHHSVDRIHDEARKKGLQSLLRVGDGDYSAAVKSYQSLIAEFPSHEDFAQNAAVALLYTGHISSARSALEDLSSRLPVFPTLLFNLSTVYELCTDRANERKNAFIERIAARTPDPQSGGWERSNFEFKL